MSQTHPLIFEPVLKSRPWGGDSLAELYAKKLPANQALGESLELIDSRNEQSVVAAGPMKGEPLEALIKQWQERLTGRARLSDGAFPLVVRLLDVHRNLSVQCHAGERMADQLGGKFTVGHRAWYVLRAGADAAIYKGFNPGVSREDVVRAVAQGRGLDTLKRVAVKAGDCHYLPGGTPYALGAGVVAAEVRTVSGQTFPLFDWLTPHHPQGPPPDAPPIDKVLECLDYAPADESAQRRSHVGSYWTTVTRLVTCQAFVIEKVRMVAGLDQPIPYAEPVIWLVLEGSGRIIYGPVEAGLAFKTGDTLLLPAELQHARVALQEDAVWLEVTIPVQSDLAAFARPARDVLQAPDGSAAAPVQITVEGKSAQRSSKNSE